MRSHLFNTSWLHPTPFPPRGSSWSGMIRCYGKNHKGQALPLTGSPTTPYKQVTVGPGGQTCAITSTDSVECWGANFAGAATPSIPGSYTQISAGRFSSKFFTHPWNHWCRRTVAKAQVTHSSSIFFHIQRFIVVTTTPVTVMVSSVGVGLVSFTVASFWTRWMHSSARSTGRLYLLGKKFGTIS